MSSVLTKLVTNDINRVNRVKSDTDGGFLVKLQNNILEIQDLSNKGFDGTFDFWLIFDILLVVILHSEMCIFWCNQLLLNAKVCSVLLVWQPFGVVQFSGVATLLELFDFVEMLLLLCWNPSAPLCHKWDGEWKRGYNHIYSVQPWFRHLVFQPAQYFEQLSQLLLAFKQNLSFLFTLSEVVLHWIEFYCWRLPWIRNKGDLRDSCVFLLVCRSQVLHVSDDEKIQGNLFFMCLVIILAIMQFLVMSTECVISN